MTLKISDFVLLTIGNLIGLMAIIAGAVVSGYTVLAISFLLVLVVAANGGRCYSTVSYGAKLIAAVGLVAYILSVLISAFCAVLA